MTAEEVEAHIETLEQHVARLEGIIQVILRLKPGRFWNQRRVFAWRRGKGGD